MANAHTLRVNETMKYVKEISFLPKRTSGSFKCVFFVIILISSFLDSSSQSLKLKNATIQQLIDGSSSQTFYRYFVLCSIKGNAKQLETDSLCVLNTCFHLLNPDSTIITKEIIRGKKKSFLRVSINSSEPKKNETLLTDLPSKQVSGVMYYRANAKSKKLLIPIFHQLPVQTVTK